MAGFVDESGLHVKGGDGGAGAVSFRREAHVAKGGPDGGDGGKGGDVWLVANANVASLLSFADRPFRRADNGGHGTSKKAHGRNGGDQVVDVPEGTLVKEKDTGHLVADLVKAGDRWMAAEGGRGGKGNARFLSNRRRAPAFAEQGEVGEEHWFDLEMKLLADVALVGFPNAGKSTLISVISAARPKIADYPFTTLVPNLGVVRRGDTEMVVADIPGLIEGASDGKGLGHQFLRHVERARAMVVLVDLAEVGNTPPLEQERVLLEELGRHRPELLDWPRLVVGSRADVGVLPWNGPRVSAVTREGVDALVGRMAEMVSLARAELPAAETFVVHRPLGEGFKVEKEGAGYVVVGRVAERAVAVSDLTDAGALDVVHERLDRLGVNRALRRAGVKDGDKVRIGELVFDYQ